MEINKVLNVDFLENKLPDKCAKLIIADPPYFKTKGDFDFIWSSFDEYLKDVERWAIECKRILADNGTLFWYGSSKNIAYSQIIFDRYFTLVNNLVWDKGQFMGLEKSNTLRSFAPCTERLLMYESCIEDITGNQFIEREYIAERNPFSIALNKAMTEKGVSVSEVAEYGKFYRNVNHGGMVTNWRKGYSIPDLKQWNILMENLPITDSYEQLKAKYDSLKLMYESERLEFENNRRFFSNFLSLQEVLRFSNERSKSAKYAHDTVKPETLTRALILSCSRVDDLVVIPFAGSGTECVMAYKENRKFLGFEIEKKYVDISNHRIYAQMKSLFTETQ